MKPIYVSHTLSVIGVIKTIVTRPTIVDVYIWHNHQTSSHTVSYFQYYDFPFPVFHEFFADNVKWSCFLPTASFILWNKLWFNDVIGILWKCPFTAHQLSTFDHDILTSDLRAIIAQKVPFFRPFSYIIVEKWYLSNNISVLHSKLSIFINLFVGY